MGPKRGACAGHTAALPRVVALPSPADDARHGGRLVIPCPRPWASPVQDRLADLVALDTRRPTWWAKAACTGQLHLFYAQDSRSQRLAIGICRSCPVKAECLADARATETAYHVAGVRAGFTAKQRRATRALTG